MKKKREHGFSIMEITGFEKYKMLINNSFRIHYLEDQDLIHDYFIILSSLANRSRIYLIERPEIPLQIVELADYLIDTIFEA